MDILEITKKNKGLKKLYSEVVILDWYDDPATGVCKLDSTEEWYIFNLCYFASDQVLRLLTLIKATDEWLENFRSKFSELKDGNEKGYDSLKRFIKDFFDSYQGDVFLIKTRYFSDENYEIVRLPLANLMYCNSVEDAVYQDEKTVAAWLSLFKAGS